MRGPAPMSRAGATDRGEEIPHRTVEPSLSDRGRERPAHAAPQAARKILKSVHMTERELQVLKAPEGTGFPAPRALAKTRARTARPFISWRLSTGASFGTRRWRDSSAGIGRPAFDRIISEPAVS
jgi:hypothetical protein